MTTKFKIKNSSTNAKKALKEGKKPLPLWTKEELITKINEMIAADEDACPEADMDRLELVDEDVLKECLLIKTEWHHVNNKPCWFYDIDEPVVKTLRKNEMSTMLRMTRKIQEESKKPRFAFIKQSSWVNFKGNHQTTNKTRRVGVVYDGYVYFENGTKAPVQKDYMDISDSCDKKSKKYKKTYSNIIRNMQVNYGLAV